MLISRNSDKYKYNISSSFGEFYWQSELLLVRYLITEALYVESANIQNC